MKRGKQTCKILKEIRKQIAEANDIEYIVSECQFQGDCLGTCPKCESEVRYLEQQLERKRMAGKVITIIGISAGVITTALLASCANNTNKAVTQIVENEKDIVSETSIVISKDSIASISIPDGLVLPTKSEDTISLKSSVAVSSSISTKMNKADETGTDITTNGLNSEEFSEKDTLEIADQMPEFPEGNQALMTFLSKNIDYGPVYQGNGTQGRVIVEFIVNKDGNIINPKVIRGVDRFLDKEALRVIKLMPKWKPGMQNGEKVNVRFRVPVMFRLQ